MKSEMRSIRNSMIPNITVLLPRDLDLDSAATKQAIRVRRPLAASADGARRLRSDHVSQKLLARNCGKYL